VPVSLGVEGAKAAIAAALPPDRNTTFAIAVSGGGDSLALLHLAVAVTRESGHPLRALTVDHRLRAEAAAEAAMVAARCAEWGVPHEVLVWDHGGQMDGNLMAAARAARYGLLSDWARRQGGAVIALGHTADDRAEGLIMALARGAGLDGLSGMRPEWTDAGGVRFVRPLLGVTRAALRAHLTAAGIGWVEDPTNGDDRYLRARVRAALAMLAPLGLDTEGMAQSVAHLSAARGALEQALSDWAAAHVTTPWGMVQIDRPAFAALHPDQRLRLVRAVLRWIVRGDHAPRGADQSRFVDSLLAGRGATLHGVRARATARHLRLFREARAVAGPVEAVDGALWDGRWRLRGPAAEGEVIRALGEDGLALRPGWRDHGIPRDAALVSPAIWRGARLIAAPLLEPLGPWQAETAGCLALFILSH
jgi:tRNA(Ile)-lysidine synthase